jgi:hypothetical protein
MKFYHEYAGGRQVEIRGALMRWEMDTGDATLAIQVHEKRVVLPGDAIVVHLENEGEANEWIAKRNIRRGLAASPGSHQRMQWGEDLRGEEVGDERVLDPTPSDSSTAAAGRGGRTWRTSFARL